MSEHALPLRVEELRNALVRAAALLRAASEAVGRVAESCDEPAIRVALENYLECHAQVLALSRQVDHAVISRAESEKWCTKLFGDPCAERVEGAEVKANWQHAVDALLRAQLLDVVTSAFEESRKAMKRHIDTMERAFARGASSACARRRNALDQ